MSDKPFFDKTCKIRCKKQDFKLLPSIRRKNGKGKIEGN